MNCAHCREIMFDYNAPEALRSLACAHLAGCEACGYWYAEEARQRVGTWVEDNEKHAQQLQTLLDAICQSLPSWQNVYESIQKRAGTRAAHAWKCVFIMDVTSSLILCHLLTNVSIEEIASQAALETISEMLHTAEPTTNC